MAKTVYLKVHTDLPRIIKLLGQLKGSEVVLVVPKDSKLFKNPDKLRLLKQKADGLNKTVVIATTNRGGRVLAQKAGFRVVKGKQLKARSQQQTVADGLASSGSGRPGLFTSIPRMVKKVLPPQAPKKTTQRKTFSLSRKKVLIVVVGLLVLVGVIFFILPQASIAVVTRSEPVTRDMEVRVNVNQEQADVSNLVIPGNMIETEIEGSRSFTPTGVRNIGKRASGFVQFYNLSKNTLILKAETTRLFIGDREYVITQDVSGLRPTAFIGQGEEQEVDESSLIAPVPVVAAAPGEQYNLTEGTRVEIRNEVLGHQPEVLYGAVASGGLTGGTTEEVRVVTEADVTQALLTVSDELVQKAREELLNQSGQQLLESAVETGVVEEHVTHQPGSETPEFEAAVRLGLKALTFEKQDALAVIRERVKRLLPSNKELPEDQEYVFDARFFVVNLDEGTGVLTTHFEARIVYQIDNDDILRRVKGKSPDEIRELLLSRPEISEVNVNLSPFWVKTAPAIEGRIKIVKQAE